MTHDPWAALDWDPMSTPTHRRSVRCGDVVLRLGDRVVLRPKGRADILDVVLSGMTATIESIEVDYEDTVHLAVIVDDDPGRDLGELRQPGHRFFFGLDDVEPVRDAAGDLR